MFGLDDVVMGGMQVAGLFSSISGGMKASAAAQGQAQASMAIAQDERQQDAIRRQAMELNAQRQQMEILRNNQRARSLSLANATSQGAAFGDASGLKGGQAQISGQSGVNLLGLSQNLQAGRQMFDLNDKIDQQKILYAQYGGQLASAQGEMSFGNSLMGGAPSAGKLAQSFGGNAFSNLMNSFST